MKLLEVFEDVTPRDKIMRYLKSSNKRHIKLLPEEEDYITRLDYCDDIIRTHRGARQKELVNMVMQKYGLSITGARNLLEDTKYIHGSCSKPVKIYERQLMTETLWDVVEKTTAAGDFSNAINAMRLISEINMLDKEDENTGQQETVNIILRPAYVPEQLGVPNPDNVDELVEQLRSRTKLHKTAQNALTP